MRQVSHALLELAQPGAHKLLPLLGHVVLGVLAEVAHRDSLLQLFGQLVIELVFENGDILCELLSDVFRHTSESMPSGDGTYPKAWMIIREVKPDRTHIEPTRADARDTPQTRPGGADAHGREPASIDPFRRTGV